MLKKKPTLLQRISAVCFLALCGVAANMAVAAYRQEQPTTGERRGDRCFNGRYWKNCGEPDAPTVPVRPAGGNLTWRYEACWTNDCIANKLNALPFERAAEAKLTTWKSETYVWYRE